MQVLYKNNVYLCNNKIKPFSFAFMKNAAPDAKAFSWRKSFFLRKAFLSWFFQLLAKSFFSIFSANERERSRSSWALFLSAKKRRKNEKCSRKTCVPDSLICLQFFSMRFLQKTIFFLQKIRAKNKIRGKILYKLPSIFLDFFLH